MSLRALKSLARTPPGHLQCSKQGIGVEKRLSATYLPFNLGDSGTVIGRDDHLDKVSSTLECLDDAGMGGSQLLNPILPYPVVSVPSGRPTVSRLNLGEDLSAAGDYPSRMDLGLRNVSSLNSQMTGNCFLVEDESQPSELDLQCQVSQCLGGCGKPSIACQMLGTSCLDGIFHSSPKLDHPLDSMGLQQSEKNACEHFYDYQNDKPSLPVIQVDGMVQEVCKNAELEIASFSDVNYKPLKSMDLENEFEPEPHYSGSIGPSKPKKRILKPIKKINPVLMTLGEDVLLNDIVLTNALTLVGRFGRRNYNADSLHGWAVRVWNGIISTIPEIYMLPRGWIAFKFSSVDDVDRILAGV